MEKPLIIAHRGSSGHAPENTMSAFQKALEQGADGIETDVHLSKDNHLIICHDERVDRTTDGKGLIKDMTVRELMKLDAGSWYHKDYTGERIPVLEELFDFLKDKNVLLDIELKNGIISYENIENKLIGLIYDYNMEKNVIISSFNHYSLLKVKRINKRITTGILYMAGIVDPWEYARKVKADAIHPYFYCIRKEIVRKCKENNILINTFTVNEIEDLTRILNMGVSGVITNFPDRAQKILEKQK